VPGTVPRTVERYAPLVYLDGDDAYPPSDPADFLAGAYLAWSRTGREEDLVAVRDPVDLDSLLTESYEHDGSAYAADALTRPFADRALRPIRLFGEEAAGFCLARRVKHPPWDVPAAFDAAPVFYDYEPRAYVTYWFFFEWSTLPLLGALDPDALDEEANEAVDSGDRSLNAVPVELWEAFPELAATYSEGDGALDEEEGFVSDAVGEARRFFRRIRARKPPRFPVLHEGDWERISVRLDEDDKLAHIAYYQHNGPPELVRPRRRGERPVVYVAKGSHASYPNPSRELSVRKLVKAAEVFGKDIEWQVEPRHLRDVRREKWYGFGGAWGRPGVDSQQTGPLGPSRFKPPTPFMLPR
jgi:hypothetical protein